MTAIEVMNAVKGKKGQHVSATWERPCKTRKSFSGIISKRTKTYVRSGISYANLAEIKDAIQRGERGEVEPLPPYYQWRKGFENYILDGVNKDGSLNGKEYIRLYPASFDNLKPTVQYFLNGEKVEFSEIENFLLESEKKQGERPPCFTLKVESIREIAGE